MSMNIHVERLTQRFGEVVALDDLTLQLEGPGIHGLLGRNAAGKSTLLSILAGFRRQTSGHVMVDGEAVFENGRLTSRICLIREVIDTVDGGESVADALAFAAYMRPRWDGAYADQLVKRFEVPRGQKINNLSRGKRAALAVIIGLASRAPLTMFDEAYLGMDAPARYTFYDELLRDYIEHPRTIIVSTHLIEELSSLFERVVIIERGRLLLNEQADTLRNRARAIVGPTAAVRRLTAGRTVLEAKSLGPTTSAVVLGELDRAALREAEADGLEVGPLRLQDLFVQLTKNNGDEVS